jgi:hypothetical protein
MNYKKMLNFIIILTLKSAFLNFLEKLDVIKIEPLECSHFSLFIGLFEKTGQGWGNSEPWSPIKFYPWF